MKIVFLSIIFLSCGLIGIMIKRYHKKRKNFYLETLSFLRKMKEEITFRKTFFKEIKNESPHSDELEDMILGKIAPESVLNNEEQKELQSYFKDVGKSSISFEIENVDKALNYVEEKCKETKDGYERKGNLSVKLGFLIGIAIFVLLV